MTSSIRTRLRQDVESQVAAIVCALLGRDCIGAEADFFENGGDSLLALQALARIRKQLGVDLSLIALLDAPTVRGWAAAIASAASPDQD